MRHHRVLCHCHTAGSCLCGSVCCLSAAPLPPVVRANALSCGSIGRGGVARAAVLRGTPHGLSLTRHAKYSRRTSANPRAARGRDQPTKNELASDGPRRTDGRTRSHTQNTQISLTAGCRICSRRAPRVRSHSEGRVEVALQWPSEHTYTASDEATGDDETASVQCCCMGSGRRRRSSAQSVVFVSRPQSVRT